MTGIVQAPLWDPQASEKARSFTFWFDCNLGCLEASSVLHFLRWVSQTRAVFNHLSWHCNQRPLGSSTEKVVCRIPANHFIVSKWSSDCVHSWAPRSFSPLVWFVFAHVTSVITLRCRTKQPHRDPTLVQFQSSLFLIDSVSIQTNYQVLGISLS